MTVAEQMHAADDYLQLWEALMPGITPPGKDQFLVWAGVYNCGQIARGISGAARKLRAVRSKSQVMSADDVARYASSIMRNELTGRRNFNKEQGTHNRREPARKEYQR